MNGMLLEDVSLAKESVETILKLLSTLYMYEFHRTDKILILNPRQGDPLGKKPLHALEIKHNARCWVFSFHRYVGV